MRRKYSKFEKLAAIQRLERGEPDSLNREMVRRWRDELQKFGPSAFTGNGNRRNSSPPKTETLVFRLRRPEYERFLACLNDSQIRSISEFARRKLFEPEPDPNQIEARIEALTDAINRLI